MPGSPEDRQSQVDRYRTSPRQDSPVAGQPSQPQPQSSNPQGPMSYAGQYARTAPYGNYPTGYGSFPPNMMWQPPAGMWDVIRDGVKFLAQHRLVEVGFALIVAAIGVGLFLYFQYVEPRRRADEAALIRELNAENTATVKQIVQEHREGLRETKEAFITEALELRKDSKAASERHLQMMEKWMDRNRAGDGGFAKKPE